MRPEYNIYCDESCHLEHDQSNVMVLGAIWCLKNKKQEIFSRIQEIKKSHKIKPEFEIKWKKVSKGGINFYLDLVNYFFDDHDLHFRALVVTDKSALNHKAFNQDHDTFFYKMYFNLLKVILFPHASYNIYIDIKDTNSQQKVLKLQDVLRNNQYDYQKQIVKHIQQVQSHEVVLLQLADLFTGAIGYLHRGLNQNAGKVALIEKMKSRSGYSLSQSTLIKEEKMNLLVWNPQANLE